MPKGRKRTIEVPVPEDFEIIDGDPLSSDVENVLAELGEDIAKVLIYRRPPKGDRQAYVGTLDANEFSLDSVARMWGGGRYLVRLKDETGRIVKGATFYIDDAIEPAPKAATPDGKSATGNPLLDTILAKLIENSLGGGGKSQDLGQVAVGMSTAMITAMAPLLAKITELSSGRGSSATEMLQLIEFGAERFGERDTGFAGVVREVGLPLVNTLERALGGAAGARRLPAAPEGGPPVSPPVAPAAPAPAPNTPPWVVAFRPYVATLVQFASRNDPPGMWAAVLDVQMPRVARFLAEQVVHPEFTEQLLTYFPQLVPYRAWVEQFLDEFMPEEPGEGESEDPGNGVEDPGNVVTEEE